MGRLQTARLENFIRRWGSIKGPGSVLSETLGDVFPVLDLENLTPENQLTAGWTQFWGFITVAGVAAQVAGCSIINPANSGQIAVVDGVIFNIQSTSSVTIGSSLPLFTPTQNVRTRDRRNPAFSGKLRIAANANVGAAATGLLVRAVAVVDKQIEIPGSLGVLIPSSQLEVVVTAVNLDMTCSFYGRVRDAEPSELSF